MITKDDLKDERFTPAYNFVMRRTDLTWPEKFCLCRALSFPSSWFESNKTISKELGCSEKTVQRAIKNLIKKGELAIFHPTEHSRTMYPTVLGLPLFELARQTAKELKANK